MPDGIVDGVVKEEKEYGAVVVEIGGEAKEVVKRLVREVPGHVYAEVKSHKNTSVDDTSSPFFEASVEGDLFLTKKKEREEEERRRLEEEIKKQDDSTNEYGLSSEGKVNKTKVKNVLNGEYTANINLPPFLNPFSKLWTLWTTCSTKF